jgi:hypothetical protein
MSLRILATWVCLLIGTIVPAVVPTAAETPVGPKNRKACDPECAGPPQAAESPYYPFEEIDVVKSLYTRPYMIRYLVDCRIDVIGSDGRRRQLSGYGVAGATWF